MRFHAELEATGKNTAGFDVPESVVNELSGGKRPKVSVTVNGHTFRTSIARMGGRYLLGVSADRREAARIKAGEVLEVDVELDTAPRKVELPADLAVALDSDPAAKAFWDTLSYSKQQWHVLQVTGAKKAETRANRLAKSIDLLRARRAR